MTQDQDLIEYIEQWGRKKWGDDFEFKYLSANNAPLYNSVWIRVKPSGSIQIHESMLLQNCDDILEEIEQLFEKARRKDDTGSV